MPLDLDHPLHQLLLRWSQKIGEPWPPDPYLGALARASVLAESARLYNYDLDAKMAELQAARATVDRLQGEARTLRDTADTFIQGAEYMVREAAREKSMSPWGKRIPDDDAPHEYPRRMTGKR